jgi:hypothetical protein
MCNCEGKIMVLQLKGCLCYCEEKRLMLQLAFTLRGRWCPCHLEGACGTQMAIQLLIVMSSDAMVIELRGHL